MEPIPEVKENTKIIEKPKEGSQEKLSNEDRLEVLETQLNIAKNNIHRLISYVETLEQWRHMPFYPTDKDGNPIDKDGNIVDPKTGKTTENPEPKK